MKRSGLLICCLLFAAAAFPAEKWWDFYNRGLTAGQSENWGSLAENMQQSISMKPAEDLNARAKKDVIVYVPHFWLGIAKFNLGDVDGAMREWDLSQSQGVIQKTRYYADLRTWVSRAQAQKVKNAASQSAGNKKSAYAALSKAVSSQVEAMGAGGDRTDAYRAAQRKLQEAWDQYNSAGNDSRAYDRAAATATQAQQMFGSVTAEAKSRKTARPPVAQRAATTPSPSPQATVPSVAVEPPRPAPPPVVSQTLADARVDLQSYRRRLGDMTDSEKDPDLKKFVRAAESEADGWDKTLRETISDAAAQQITGAVRARTRDLEDRIAAAQLKVSAPAGTVTLKGQPGKPSQLTAAARGELKKAYLAFSQGSIDEAEAILTEIIAKGDGVDQAYLLRGCVRYTKGMLRKNGNDIVSQASDDFRRAVTMNASLGLDPKHFSPKLITHFKDVQRQQMAKR